MQPLAILPNGKKVYYDPQRSHAATHLDDDPHLLALARQFLSEHSFDTAKVYVDQDSGRIIGNTDLLETNGQDDILYAKRLNRDTYTRFVKGRSPEPTSYFTVAMLMDHAGNYELVSTWIGRVCPNFPDEADATPESRPFWATHALAWGKQKVQSGTETQECPW